MNKTICICGGGSLGIVCAGVLLAEGHKVNLLTGHPDNWSRHIKVVDCDGKEFGGELNEISSEAREVVPGADIVLLCVPGYLIEQTLRDIKPFIGAETLVGSIVSSTGFFFKAHEVLDSTTPLFGFQRVPYIARCKVYGEVGELLGYKPSLNVALENVRDVSAVKEMMEELFGTPVNVLDNFYEASLTNSNPILHTARLYSMWKDHDGKPQERLPLFYAEWTEDAAEMLIAMDSEFQQLLKTLGIREGVIPSLLDYYESVDAPSLARKLRSIVAFKDIPSPMKQTPGGWVPDFGSRYFTEDFPYGLKYIKELIDKYGIDAPAITKVYEWGISKISR